MAVVQIQDPRPDPVGRRRVVVLDCGVKYNILRNLEQRGCEVLVLPATATGEEILALRPDGRPALQRSRRSGGAPVYRGGGPVDPGEGPHLRHLPGSPDPGSGGRGTDGETQVRPSRDQPAGTRTAGTAGSRSPPRTTGSWSFPNPSRGSGRRSTNNLNDHTSEGIRYPALKAFSVQYHPEAAPGPHDADYLFDEFISAIDRKGESC